MSSAKAMSAVPTRAPVITHAERRDRALRQLVERSLRSVARRIGYGRAPLERRWARPTADINGIWGGYQGPGSKTVIAAEAGAKVSFRLVPGQDPDAVVAAFRQFLAGLAPSDADISVEVFSASPGIEIPAGGRFLTAAQAALADEFGRPAVLIGSGGSIPVVESLRRVLGIDSLLMGFGLDDDQVHSPNEKFEWTCFRHGIRSHIRLLGQLASPA